VNACADGCTDSPPIGCRTSCTPELGCNTCIWGKCRCLLGAWDCVAFCTDPGFDAGC
jgi:hypothetical protein